MALWLVRAGRFGEREDYALSKKVAVVGWDELPNLLNYANRKDLENSLKEIYPDAQSRKLKLWEGMLWKFSREIKPGDIIVLPLKARPVISFGEVTGQYGYDNENPDGAKHFIPVHWLKEFPRTSFDSDLRYSFGSLSTVCGISRNNAEARIRAKLAGEIEPLDEGEGDHLEEVLDIEQITQDQIVSYIDQKYKGHELARLVGDLLMAQGYHVRVSPPGADGGVDILAGSGALGLESPKLAVQVKSGSSPVDFDVLRSFSGVMDRFRAEHGLIVAWAGFRGTVEREAVHEFFKIRLWDGGDLVQNLQKYYDKLPDNTKAELPLKRIWILVPEEEE
jgi:restriction system protein